MTWWRATAVRNCGAAARHAALRLPGGAENVRQQVGCARIDLPAELGFEQKLAVTVSVGGAWYRDQESPQTLVDRADRALYQSKENGRNKVTWESRQTGS